MVTLRERIKLRVNRFQAEKKEEKESAMRVRKIERKEGFQERERQAVRFAKAREKVRADARISRLRQGRPIGFVTRFGGIPTNVGSGGGVPGISCQYGDGYQWQRCR